MSGPRGDMDDWPEPKHIALASTLADLRRCRLILAGSNSTKDLSLCEILDECIKRLSLHLSQEAAE